MGGNLGGLPAKTYTNQAGNSFFSPFSKLNHLWTISLEKHKVLLCRKSLLNTEVVLKRKKSTWTHQTDPFLFDLCQVTLKKDLYVESVCRVKAAEPMPGFISKKSRAGQLLLTALSQQLNSFANFLTPRQA